MIFKFFNFAKVKNGRKENWLKILGNLFLAVGGIAAVISICSLLFSVACPKPDMFSWFSFCGLLFAVTLFHPDVLDWTSLAILATALAALGANFLVLSKNSADKQEQRSRSYLDSCVLAYENASEILINVGNVPKHRVATTWVCAATILLHIRELAKEIKDESHRRIFKVHQQKYENIFSALLETQHHGDLWQPSIMYAKHSNPDLIYKYSKMVLGSAPTPYYGTAAVPAQAIRMVCLEAGWLPDSDIRGPLLKDQNFTEEELDSIGLSLLKSMGT